MFKKNDWTLLIEEDRNYKIVAKVGSGLLQTIRGYIDTDTLIGVPYGTVVTSTLGAKFRAIPATIFDIIEHRFRIKAQAIYPKDAIYIVKATAIGPGSRVVEAGTGSGFLTAVLAWYVRPWGIVYSFEKRFDHIRVAIKNIKSVGLDLYVDLQLRDVVKSGFGSMKVDAVILDMGDPWNVIEKAVEVLKSGGTLAVFSTTIEHMSKTVEMLKTYNFYNISIEEVLLRRWKSVVGELRPETFDVVHTGWIITARKA
ncbi:beta-aspartate methyltransferase, conjectural [Pyrobaculum islandicum DSM 4184]|uniref:Beta-aspartate methyltransferase, conjectural n=1 Tax=Pyrobaculum islandicum (strain DSM 4184 / JCM 9189 / GEO3) TaxID=384616 RepID=A1RSR7_PYRIL|nr:tRNA (adenine-N1)-methyltransferase [Pyrobaculum islandicum]ABL87999.1 beta-aspartate methyltransferase, conjectural [Pyrobaculum islandicum DSM 4184]